MLAYGLFSNLALDAKETFSCVLVQLLLVCLTLSMDGVTLWICPPQACRILEMPTPVDMVVLTMNHRCLPLFVGQLSGVKDLLVVVLVEEDVVVLVSLVLLLAMPWLLGLP